MAKFGREFLSHPQYSPDLAPSDHHSFRSLGNGLTDRTFKNERRENGIVRILVSFEICLDDGFKAYMGNIYLINNF